MCMMPHAVPYQCASHMRVGHVHGAEMSEISQSLRTKLIHRPEKELNLKSECILVSAMVHLPQE